MVGRTYLGSYTSSERQSRSTPRTPLCCFSGRQLSQIIDSGAVFEILTKRRYRANPQKYTIIWGRETFPNAKVKISEETCPVKDGEIGIRVYERADSEAEGEKRPVYMNFHGGGWVFGNLDTDQEFCKMIAHKLGCVVFDVDYRLAPEFRHPTQVQDTWAAFQWMREQKAEQYGLDLDRVAVGGASAGGHLAAVVGLKCRDAGIPLAFQVLHVPVCDMHVFTPTGELKKDCPYPSYRELWVCFSESSFWLAASDSARKLSHSQESG